MGENANTSSLLALQPELKLEVINYLKEEETWQQDLCNWSAASSHFRSLLVPYISTSITLRNTEKSGTSVNLIAKSTYSQYVRQFSFEGTAPGDEEDGFEDTEAILPGIVEDVICNLSQFPNLEAVRIKFPITFSWGWGEGFMLFQDTETAEKRVEAELEQAWRALNTRVYAALARNINPRFKRLELDSLIPAEASSFSTPEFRQLLGQMTHFTFSTWEDENSHYAACTRYGFVEYTDKFDTLFFNHLSSVTHLSISSSLPLGLYSFRHGALKLNHDQLSQLRSLYLDGIFICPELKKFLSSHAQTLESIQLSYCHAGSLYNRQRLKWEELFTALSDKNPSKLREFDVSPSHDFELFNEHHATQEQKDEAALALEILKTHPERRLFSHSYVDDKYGFVGQCQDANLKSFQLGNDQRAYDRLMRIVLRNAAE